MIILIPKINWKNKQSIFISQDKLDYATVSSVTQSCLTLCNPMDCSMPSFPVHHQLSEPTQTKSIELVMPSKHFILFSPSPPAFNLSQHQGTETNPNINGLKQSRFISFPSQMTTLGPQQTLLCLITQGLKLTEKHHLKHLSVHCAKENEYSVGSPTGY